MLDNRCLDNELMPFKGLLALSCAVKSLKYIGCFFLNLMVTHVRHCRIFVVARKAIGAGIIPDRPLHGRLLGTSGA